MQVKDLQSHRTAIDDKSQVLTCGSGTSAEVIDENRSIHITNHTFRDNFADSNAVHLYRVDGTDGCDLP